jgi:L-lactate dehydrogenase complex protein LldG
MMSPARTAILSRIRSAQKSGAIPYAKERRAADRNAGLTGPAPMAVLTRFLDELSALGVAWYLENAADDVRERVTEIVGGQPVLAWDANRLPYRVGAQLRNCATGASPRDLQAAAAIGVTGCDAAIAETGSLVLLSGAGKPRTASLLPPVHLAVVRRSDLRATMGEFFRERAADIAASSCCTFVTGPSRTADIELTLTLGVHGPGQVIVIVGPD